MYWCVWKVEPESVGRTQFESINREGISSSRSRVGVHDVGTVVHVESREWLAQLGVRFVLMVQCWVCTVVQYVGVPSNELQSRRLYAFLVVFNTNPYKPAGAQ